MCKCVFIIIIKMRFSKTIKWIANTNQIFNSSQELLLATHIRGSLLSLSLISRKSCTFIPKLRFSIIFVMRIYLILFSFLTIYKVRRIAHQLP